MAVTELLETNENIPYDIGLSGVDQNGNLDEIFDKDAFINSLRLWLVSKSNEIIRSPGKGGIIFYWLLKPMNEVSENDIIFSIRDGAEIDFVPAIEVSNIQVTPDYTNKTWRIQFEVYSPTLKIKVSLDETIRNQYQG